MKGMDILCASQASTAIRMMDEGSSSSSSTIHLGRAIDRYNPIIQDSSRTPKLPRNVPNKPRSDENIPRKSTSKRNKNIEDDFQKRKINSTSNNSSSVIVNNQKQSVQKGGWGCMKPGDFISPPGSTRYLLSEKGGGVLSDLDPVMNMGQPVNNKEQQSPVSVQKVSPSSDQVVVLRVSLHCKGCEKKMKKHISKMEGVKSFTIDFMAKKVTVIGDITPLSVLASISKVKNAQLLPPAISSSAPAAPIASDHRADVTHFNAVLV